MIADPGDRASYVFVELWSPIETLLITARTPTPPAQKSRDGAGGGGSLSGSYSSVGTFAALQLGDLPRSVGHKRQDLLISLPQDLACEPWCREGESR